MIRLSQEYSLDCKPQIRHAHAHRHEPEFGLLGRLLLSALAFAKAKFDATVELDDPVTGERKPAGEMFEEKGRRWLVRPDSLPGDLAVKAAVATNVSLMLETAPVLPARLHELAREEEIPLVWDNGDAFITGSKRHALYVHRRAAAAFVGERKIRVSRSLWTIPHRGGALSDTVRDAIRLADRAFERYAYEEENTIADELSEPANATAAPARAAAARDMRLELGFQQQLAMEQRPLLCVEGNLFQRMELGAIMALNRTLLSMSDEELAAWVAKDLSPEGQRRALNVLVFMIAGKFKAARPEISWKDARAAARKSVLTPSRT